MIVSSFELFLSTLSLRRATRQEANGMYRHWNFYPRSPCGERPRNGVGSWIYLLYFYPRSPCGERRFCYTNNASRHIFLSTLSLRRATSFAFSSVTLNSRFLSTLSLRRATQYRKSEKQGKRISIHALLAESDASNAAAIRKYANFYPRSPCGERLGFVQQALKMMKFLSTLSLRRATAGKGPTVKGYRNFYPRSPCGERHYLAVLFFGKY